MMVEVLIPPLSASARSCMEELSFSLIPELTVLNAAADMEETEAAQRQRVEEQVEMLLGGQGWEVERCDVGLEQSRPAALRKTVTYIVCAVILNDKVLREDDSLNLVKALVCQGLMCVCLCQEEVLMVQEAKPDCYKLWYLPAGRVEVGESLEEALRREVRHTQQGNGVNVVLQLELFLFAGERGGRPGL